MTWTAHLREPLEVALEALRVQFPGVGLRLLRRPLREGLTRARLAGATLATGSVLTFLDAHCEAARDWLPPLLEQIRRDR